MPLGDGDLPALYGAADTSSLQAQNQYRHATAAVLLLLILAAAGGLVTTSFGPGTTDWGGVVAAIAFFGALLVQLEQARSRPERAWYEGRALAESAKSLGWQYSVGGGRYGRDTTRADEALRADLRSLLEDIGDARPIEVAAGSAQVTFAMDALRGGDLDTRRREYLRGRIADQRGWYAQKARWNRKRARIWLLAIIALQIVGGTAAIVKATGTVDVDLLGLASAVTASVVAWVRLKDHAQLDEAYSLASHELSLVESGIDEPTLESEWARFVADAEQAISREHRMWRAARATRLR